MINPAIKKKLKEKYPTEQVFVIPYDKLFNIQDKYSSINSYPKEIQDLTHWESKGSFIFRHDAEYDPSFQQLIPYTVIFNKHADKVYVGKRIAGDSRLVQQYSLGFGGHINPCDFKFNLGRIVEEAATRELNEEVILTNKHNFKWQGFLRDVTSNTSEHLGFVFTIQCSTAKINEKESLKGKWMSLDNLVKKFSHFERWSQYIIDIMFLQHKTSGRMLYQDQDLI